MTPPPKKSLRQKTKIQNLLAKSDSIFQDMGKVQLIPQTFGRLRIVELTVQNRFDPIKGLAGSLQAKFGLALDNNKQENKIIRNV